MYLLKLALLSTMLLIAACSSIDTMFGPIDPPTQVRETAVSSDAAGNEHLVSENQDLKAEIVVLRQEVKVLLGVIKRMQATDTARMQAEDAARMQTEEAAHMQAEEAARMQAKDEARKTTVPTDRLWVTVSVRPGFKRLTKETHNTLAKLAAQFMSKPREETLDIRGYTDDEPVGGYENSRREPTHPFKTNIALSEARARSVANALIEAGIPKDKIHVQGYGAKDFVAGNKTAHERAQNRRVEIHLIKP